MKKTIFILLVVLSLFLLVSCSSLVSQLNNENEYFLEWSYCDSDKILCINKSSGIFIFAGTGESIFDKLFEVSLKKQLQAKGYNNIILATYCADFNPNKNNCFEYAISKGCDFLIGFEIENSWIYEKGGGLAGSSSVCYLYDIKSIVSDVASSFYCTSYNFIVSANNNFQSYEASLVTFNSFITKQIMKEINVHLTGEQSANLQAFFDYRQKGVIEDYFKNKE